MAEERRDQGMRAEHARKTDALRWIMGDLRGRAYLYDLIERRLSRHEVFCTNSMKMAENAALYDFGKGLKADIKAACFDLWQLAERENDGAGNRNKQPS